MYDTSAYPCVADIIRSPDESLLFFGLLSHNRLHSTVILTVGYQLKRNNTRNNTFDPYHKQHTHREKFFSLTFLLTHYCVVAFSI